MEQIVPWPRLLKALSPYYYPDSHGKRGRPPIPLKRMLRMYFVQQWYALADEALEDAIYDSQALRDFVGIDLSVESVPGATTLLKFRHLLEKQALTQVIFEQINGHLAERGMLMREGTIVDATIIAAPPSTKNRAKARTDDANRSATKDLDLTITDVDTTPTPPTAAINVSGDQVPDQDLTFNAGDSTGASLTYAWTFGDGNMANGIQVTHAYTAAGDYRVELTVTDSANQTNKATQVLTITASPGTVQKVSASDLTDDDRFGYAVAIEGTTVLIGAYTSPTSAYLEPGKAYFYDVSDSVSP